ncbi:AsnC family transcriptional regulator [Nocardioides convexus]|uniref:winged helix-turn-helix transcriptional regulator n=1 Tax=Nocardioides convexus TaxID=2712224 RepID=UPI002418769F|nr:AsnC family transcriptional regulator [Nocardioides convexus]
MGSVRDVPESWPVESSADLHRDAWVLALRSDQVRRPGDHDEESFRRLVVEHPGAAVVLALDEDDRVLCIRQYRHPAQARLVEPSRRRLRPPGRGSGAGRPARACARRSRSRPSAGRTCSRRTGSPGYSAERIHYFLAEGLSPADRGDFELAARGGRPRGGLGALRGAWWRRCSAARWATGRSSRWCSRCRSSATEPRDDRAWTRSTRPSSASLQDDARLANNVLAARVGIAPSTCHGRVRGLFERGIIRGAHAEVDQAAIGRPLQAMISVRLRPHARGEPGRLRPCDDRVCRRCSTSTSSPAPTTSSSTSRRPARRSLREFVVNHLSGTRDVAMTETSLIFEHLRGRPAEPGSARPASQA